MSGEQNKPKNPFPPDDRRHGLWNVLSSRHTEAGLRVNSRMMSKPFPKDLERQKGLVMQFILEHFDVDAATICATVADHLNVDKASTGIDQRKNYLLQFARETVPITSGLDDLMETLEWRMSGRVAHWKAECIRVLRESESEPTQTSDDEAPIAPSTGPILVEDLNVKHWEDLSIHFIDGHVVRLECGQKSVKLTYAELGFKDGRNGNPNIQWEILRELAKGKGQIKERNDLEDRLTTNAYKKKQKIRKELKATFGFDDDPFLKTHGMLYHVRFKIAGDL